MQPWLAAIWRFARGDTEARQFEQWAYAQQSLERSLGADLYAEVIGADYRDVEAVRQVRANLAAFARSVANVACECVTLADTSVLDMADPGRGMQFFKERKSRGEPYWWLSFSECSVCGTPWLTAQEERQNDVFVLRRLSDVQAAGINNDGVWPDYLDHYETLLALGRQAGHSVRWVDPIGSSSLAATVQDLARDRPGIKISELMSLLNIEREIAATIAEQVVRAHGVEIDLEDQAW